MMIELISIIEFLNSKLELLSNKLIYYFQTSIFHIYLSIRIFNGISISELELEEENLQIEIDKIESDLKSIIIKVKYLINEIKFDTGYIIEKHRQVNTLQYMAQKYLMKMDINIYKGQLLSYSIDRVKNKREYTN